MVTDGEFELLLPDHPAIWAFLRRGRDAELLVAANFSADVVSAALPLDGDWADAAVVLTSLSDQSPLQPPPDLKLRPWESVIWRARPLTGGAAQPMAAAMISRACSWMAARCSGPRKDSAYSL